MARRRYTHAEKASAVVAAEVNGVTQAAEATGVPRKTLEYWVHSEEFAQLRQETRETKRDGYRVLVALAQKRLRELIPSMEPRDLTILLGVAQDKDLLLSGDATSRTESVTLTDGLSDDEKRRLRDAIAEATRAETGSGRDGDGVALPSEEGAAAA